MLFFSAVLYVAAKGMATLGELETAADGFAAEWQEEYAIRRCIQLAATDANLRDAAGYLATLAPDLRPRLAGAAGELAAALQAAYAPVTPRADATGFCPPAGGLELSASLHRQRHPGQPPHWPNWVARFAASE